MVSTFYVSKSSHVAYQMKGIERRAPCKHIFCPYTHIPPVGWRHKVKICFFLKVVMLNIKLKEMDGEAPCKHIFCPYTHHSPLRWSQKVRTVVFSESIHVAYRNKGNGA